MVKDIIAAMEIARDFMDELHQAYLQVIADELKGMHNKTFNNKKTTAAKKKKNIEINVNEWKSVVQETISNLAQKSAGDGIDCGPVTICFVLKDAEDVSIYNGACQKWDTGNCP
ncbi:MAG: hypothetical protein A4E53_02627 [Pelotomaculum sp. PtaB.Bin104]|nr:MAG: hypothetical protein A4E53_02627 [Pelotomaculum sp. PtaB.Bin104]